MTTVVTRLTTRTWIRQPDAVALPPSPL